jgi:hypothetical protein
MSPRLVRLIAAVVVLKVAGLAALALAAVRYKQTAPPLPDAEANDIDVAVVMDGARYVSTATAFRGGRVTCWYGGADLDLREATIDPAGARLEVRTAFGGTRIVVASGVPIRVHAPAFFGGTANATGAAEPGAGSPGLEIRGFTVLGGLQIVAAAPGADLVDWAGDGAAGRSGDDAAPTPEGPDAAPDVTPA